MLNRQARGNFQTLLGRIIQPLLQLRVCTRWVPAGADCSSGSRSAAQANQRARSANSRRRPAKGGRGGVAEEGSPVTQRLAKAPAQI